MKHRNKILFGLKRTVFPILLIGDAGIRIKKSRKKFVAFAMAGTIAMSLYGCGKQETGNAAADVETEVEANDVAADTKPDTEVSRTQDTERDAEDRTQDTERDAEDSQMQDTKQESQTQDRNGETEFSFTELTNYQFCFSSGAGGWATMLNIRADGSFFGEYYDSDMGSAGEGYPNGTMYQSDFTGTFTHPVKVDDRTYSMEIDEINYAMEPGSEEIKDDILYCYTTAYGLDNAGTILIYLPGTPLAELSEEVRIWLGCYDLSSSKETELSSYALNNEASQFGFTSYDLIESLKESISYTEQGAAELEASIEQEPLTQLEYNEKTGELYNLWDSALNMAWDVLTKVKDPKTMEAITAEEHAWIAEKEQAILDAGAAYEGGSMQPMVQNQKAAELTKARVYELMELL